MNFEIFLLNYKEELKKRPKNNKIIKYRVPIVFLYIAVSCLITFIYWDSEKLIYMLLALSIILTIIAYFIGLKKENKEEIRNIKKDAHIRDITFLNNFLKKNNLLNREKINYYLYGLKMYKQKYSLKKIVRYPIKMPIIFIYFIHPKIYQEIQNMSRIVYGRFLFLIILLLGIIYFIFVIFFLPIYETCEKLEEDFKYILSFEEIL